jgi:exopolysaccharide biosynthesis WecB/TagA/CpsF family protein
VRVGFVGDATNTHRRLRELVGECHPTIRVVALGASGSDVTDPDPSKRIAAQIRNAGVDISLVGLGKPHQEEWIAHFGPATGATLLLKFGAVIDFLAGRMSRVPESAADAGVEWAWPLMLEPQQPDRRCLIDSAPGLLRLKRTASG